MDPKLNFIHVCDYASMGDSGKLNILGIFENIFITNALPYTHTQLYIVTNVTTNKTEEHKQTIKIIKDEDGKEIIKSLEFEISTPLSNESPNSKERKTGFIGQLNGVKFDSFGNYTVQVFIDTTKVGEAKINVSEIK